MSSIALLKWKKKKQEVRSKETLEEIWAIVYNDINIFLPCLFSLPPISLPPLLLPSTSETLRRTRKKSLKKGEFSRPSLFETEFRFPDLDDPLFTALLVMLGELGEEGVFLSCVAEAFVGTCQRKKKKRRFSFSASPEIPPMSLSPTFSSSSVPTFPPVISLSPPSISVSCSSPTRKKSKFSKIATLTRPRANSRSKIPAEMTSPPPSPLSSASISPSPPSRSPSPPSRSPSRTPSPSPSPSSPSPLPSIPLPTSPQLISTFLTPSENTSPLSHSSPPSTVSPAPYLSPSPPSLPPLSLFTSRSSLLGRLGEALVRRDYALQYILLTLTPVLSGEELGNVDWEVEEEEEEEEEKGEGDEAVREKEVILSALKTGLNGDVGRGYADSPRFLNGKKGEEGSEGEREEKEQAMTEKIEGKENGKEEGAKRKERATKRRESKKGEGSQKRREKGQKKGEDLTSEESKEREEESEDEGEVGGEEQEGKEEEKKKEKRRGKKKERRKEKREEERENVDQDKEKDKENGEEKKEKEENEKKKEEEKEREEKEREEKEREEKEKEEKEKEEKEKEKEEERRKKEKQAKQNRLLQEQEQLFKQQQEEQEQEQQQQQQHQQHLIDQYIRAITSSRDNIPPQLLFLCTSLDSLLSPFYSPSIRKTLIGSWFVTCFIGPVFFQLRHSPAMKQDKGKLSPEMEDFLVTIRRAVLSAAGVKGVKFSDEEQVVEPSKQRWRQKSLQSFFETLIVDAPTLDNLKNEIDQKKIIQQEEREMALLTLHHIFSHYLPRVRSYLEDNFHLSLEEGNGELEEGVKGKVATSFWALENLVKKY